jgi:hypothetical protein
MYAILSQCVWILLSVHYDNMPITILEKVTKYEVVLI